MDFPKNYKIQQKIKLEEGLIVVVRFIRSNLILNIFGEHFKVNNRLLYCYVEALIIVKSQILQVRRDGEIVQTFEYITPVDW